MLTREHMVEQLNECKKEAAWAQLESQRFHDKEMRYRGVIDYLSQVLESGIITDESRPTNPFLSRTYDTEGGEHSGT